MDVTGETIRSLGSLSNILDSQISETSTQIEAITKAAKSLVPLPDFEELIKENASSDTSAINESYIISKLHKARLELLMDVQKQDFFAEKMQEMINESEELIRSIIEYYDSSEERQKLETEASSKRFSHYTDEILGEKLELLKLNSSNLEASYNKAAANAHETLTSIQDGQKQLQSKEYQAQLDDLIQTMNQKFSSYTKED